MKLPSKNPNKLAALAFVLAIVWPIIRAILPQYGFHLNFWSFLNIVTLGAAALVLFTGNKALTALLPAAFAVQFLLNVRSLFSIMNYHLGFLSSLTYLIAPLAWLLMAVITLGLLGFVPNLKPLTVKFWFAPGAMYAVIFLVDLLQDGLSYLQSFFHGMNLFSMLFQFVFAIIGGLLPAFLAIGLFMTAFWLVLQSGASQSTTPPSQGVAPGSFTPQDDTSAQKNNDDDYTPPYDPSNSLR